MYICITTPQWFEILSEEKLLFLCICLSSSFEKISGGNANKGAPAEIIQLQCALGLGRQWDKYADVNCDWYRMVRVISINFVYSSS